MHSPKIDKDIFAQAIYDVVKRIPYGRATSYGAIAKAVGHPNLSRMVGRVMGECNSKEKNIPAHRVVNSQGFLSAKSAFGLGDEMQIALQEEGIVVANDRIKNWKKIFWNPLHEINL